MTSLLRRTSPTAISATRAAARPAGGVRRRRWGRIGVGIAAAVVGGWVFAALYRSADDRVAVVVAANEVEQFDVLERSDLRVVDVGVDASVGWIESDRLDSLVGRTMAMDVAAGSAFTSSMLVADGEDVVSNGEAVVGIVVGPGDGPGADLSPGDTVSVVVRPAQGGDASVAETPGWVLRVGEVSTNDERSVSVVVPRAQAGAVSAAAADGLVSLLVVGTG